MDPRVTVAFRLLLLLVPTYCSKLQESECVYQYLEQPPVDIICDPYSPRSTGLSLQCQVLAAGPSSSYSVGWFYYPSNSADDDVQPRQISVTSTIRDDITSTTSTMTVTHTLRPRMDGSSPGFYYCQVIPSDQSVSTVPSDNFTLYAPEDKHYLTFIICESSVPRFKSEVKCALPTVAENDTNTTTTQPRQDNPTTLFQGDDRGILITTQNVISETATTLSLGGDEQTPTPESSSGAETNVTFVDSGVEDPDSGKNSSLLPYQIYVYVLTPVILVILVILVIVIAVYLGRKINDLREQQKKYEQNRTRGRRAGRGGLNQLQESLHRVLIQQPRTITHISSTLDLQPNPSYLENSRNAALLSRTYPYQNSPLLESTPRQDPRVQRPDPCRQDITREEDHRGSTGSYEDSSYVIMRSSSSSTNRTYQSSGAYESML